MVDVLRQVVAAAGFVALVCVLLLLVLQMIEPARAWLTDGHICRSAPFRGCPLTMLLGAVKRELLAR